MLYSYTIKLVRFYDGVDGLKTGFTSGAGYCMTATAKKDGMRIIAVVMGEETSKIRNKEISEMFDYSFAQYKVINLLKGKTTIGKYRVENGKDEYVNIVAKEEANVLKKKSEKLGKISYNIKINNLKASLNKGDIVGKAYIKENNTIIKTINLTVNKSVLKADFINLLLRNIKDIIIGNMKLSFK